ncbi:MAG: helix-turn-helix transcriptional regulator [Gammaproteobacteria bacterium]|nr:helix-turn-helix transcriptional regulator [Gammaproteobacteria bacterium]
MSLLTVSKAQKKLAENLRARRLSTGLTQEGLANRSGVSLPSLRKFEQKGGISLESFLKLLMVLDILEQVVLATEFEQAEFLSIDEVLESSKKTTRKKGWRK